MIINNSLNINTYSIKKNITNLLDNVIEDNLYYLDLNGKDILNQKQKEIIKKNILNNFKQNIDYNLYLSIEKGYCIHQFCKGTNVGKYCNRRIYIKDCNNINLFCSRHNKNYNVIQRTYEKNNRCEYIRENGLQCRNHSKYNKFCFVHKHHNIKIDPFIRLNKLRDIYYKKIKIKRKKSINNYKKKNSEKNDQKNTFSQNSFTTNYVRRKNIYNRKAIKCNISNKILNHKIINRIILNML